MRIPFTFKLAWDTIGMHKGAAMWLLPFFMKCLGAFALHFPIVLSPKSQKHRKERILTRYSKGINFLLETYVTNDDIAEKDAENLRLTRPSNMTPTEYADVLWNKALLCELAHDKHAPKSISIEGLHRSFRHSIRSYWG